MNKAKRNWQLLLITKRFQAGDAIFSQGSLGQNMMAIAEGTVRVSMLSPTSKDVTLAELGPGRSVWRNCDAGWWRTLG